MKIKHLTTKPNALTLIYSSKRNIAMVWCQDSQSVLMFSTLDKFFREKVLISKLDLGHFPPFPGKVINLHQNNPTMLVIESRNTIL